MSERLHYLFRRRGKEGKGGTRMIGREKRGEKK